MKNPFSIRSEMGIRKRVFFLLLVVFVPLLLLEFFVYFKWFQVSKQTEMQANMELARSVAKNFETFLQGLVRGELGMGLALTASLPMPDRDRDRMLDKFQADNSPAVRSIFWMNSDGLVIASSLRTYVGFNLSDRSFFQQVKEGWDWAVSELIVGRATGRPAFTVSRAIRNEGGELLGVVAATIEPDRLDSVLGIVRSEDAGVSLIDNKGMHVYRYPPRTFTPEQRDWLKLYPVIGEALKGQEVMSVHQSKITKKGRIAAFAPITSIGWVATCSRSEDEVIAGITKTLLPQAMLVLLVTLAAFGAAVGFSRPIIKSIIKLKNHASALGQGETDRIVLDAAPIELKKLADTMNEMSDEIRSRETALKESEERFRSVFENASTGILIADVNRDYLAVNDRFCEITGYTRAQLLTKGCGHIVHPDDQSTDIADVERLLRGEASSFIREMRYLHASGETIGVRANVSIMRSNGQGDAQLIAVVEDITERKRAEEDLRAARDMQQMIMNNIPQGIFWKDRRSTYLGGNNVFEKAVGLESAGSIVGKTDYDLPWSMEQTESFREYDRRIMESDTPEYHIIEQMRDVDGKLAWVETNKIPLHDAQGNVIGILGTYEDITERKQMVEELHRSRGELENRVEAKTVELKVTNRALSEYAAKLEGLNQELKDFAFITSHDLSEPLRKVQTFGSLLEAKSADLLDEQSRGYVSRMTGAASRMKELLDALLRYSRVDTKGQDFRPTKLNDVVKEASGDLQGPIEKVGAKVKIGELPIVDGYPSQLRQLFQNLIGNAVKYHRSEVKTIIKVHGEQNMGICHIFVEDNGIGFDEKYLDKIFLPFQRLHGRNEYPGTGIGLAICKKIVERHGGTITAKSTPGKGSTFIVTLPKDGTKARSKPE